MKRRYRIAGWILVLFAGAIAALAYVLAKTDECPAPPAVAADAATMKAIRYYCYGDADVLVHADVERPRPDANEVLVKVKAASVNPLDWHFMRGSPFFMRLGTGLGAPDVPRLGVDFAGTVASVGADVTRFNPGEDVFGGQAGAFSEYLVIAEDHALVHKPEEVSFEQAASVPIAGLTALQALRDHGQLRAGQKVLINGASGGVGTFAVQIAKSMGAEVYGVCSTRNVEMVRSIGADYVFDYKKENYTESDEKFDLIVDMVGNHSLLANRKVMSDAGRMVIVGGAKGDWLGPILRPFGAVLLSPFVEQDMQMIISTFNSDDLATVGDLIARGEVRPVIDRRYRLSETADAIRYSESGRARGKIIIGLE